jgi:hypothetical protein
MGKRNSYGGDAQKQRGERNLTQFAMRDGVFTKISSLG